MTSLSRTLIYDYEQNPDSGNRTLIPATTWWRWQQKQDTAHGGYPIRENSTWWISNQGKLGERMTHASLLLLLMRSIPFS